MKLTKKELKKLELETLKTGFVVWVNDIDTTRHWVVDASCIKTDGIIHLCENSDYRINAKYDKGTESIKIYKK